MEYFRFNIVIYASILLLQDCSLYFLVQGSLKIMQKADSGEVGLRSIMIRTDFVVIASFTFDSKGITLHLGCVHTIPAHSEKGAKRDG